jgi:phage-related minor tail protein
MGEGGPEAILPLSRGSDGRLGVQAPSGGGNVTHVTFNISTPDADSFRRSQGQIAAQLSRAVAAGSRNR